MGIQSYWERMAIASFLGLSEVNFARKHGKIPKNTSKMAQKRTVFACLGRRIRAVPVFFFFWFFSYESSAQSVDFRPISGVFRCFF
jgi:hypothetical protein